MTDAQLCERFDNDILYDCHNLNSRIERSHARKELLRRGKPALGSLITHLENHPKLTGRTPELPGLVDDLRLCWGVVLNHFEIDLDPTRSAPQSRLDTTGWIAWAKKIAA